MFRLHFNPFEDYLDDCHARSEWESSERATPWLEFRFERLMDFAKQLEKKGFGGDGSSQWRHRLGWIDLAPLPWHRESGVCDSIQMLSVWTYKLGNGTRLLRQFCQAMDQTKRGILCSAVCRAFNHGLDGETHEDEIRPGGIQTAERLKRFYSHFNFVDCGLSEGGRPLVVRTSPNYKPNPHPYTVAIEDNKQGNRGGCVTADAAATQSNVPALPFKFDFNRPNYHRTHANGY